MRRIRAEHAVHPETEGWWPIGQGIGYGASFVNQAADLLELLARRAVGAGPADRARVQAVARRSSGPAARAGGGLDEIRAR